MPTFSNPYYCSTGKPDYREDSLNLKNEKEVKKNDKKIRDRLHETKSQQ